MNFLTHKIVNSRLKVSAWPGLLRHTKLPLRKRGLGAGIENMGETVEVEVWLLPGMVNQPFSHFAIELYESVLSLPMAHDVFISHAHKDIAIAKAICDELEAAQVKCWITERDIPSGENWPEATRNAIRSSRVMVLLLSENANAASHIEREIAHAFYTGRTIYPVRLTNTPLKRDFLYYLGNVRCFDAFNPPIEQYFAALVAGVRGKMHGGPLALNVAQPR